MNLKKIFLKTRISFITFLSLFVGCNSDDQNFKDFDAGGTATEVLAGEWFVREYDNSNSPISEYYKILVSNTAANTSSEILLTRVDKDVDGNDVITKKIKANSDISNLTFQASDVENLEDDSETINISEGRIIKEGTFASSTRTVVDSIAFQFSSNTIAAPILVAGHRRTGFREDEVVE